MANGIVRWNPFREMAAMQNMMERLFEDTWRPFFDEGRIGANTLALDVHETDKNYIVTTELPGIKPENIQVKVEGDVLMIDAETKETTEREGDGSRPLIRERRYGRFSRRLRLPQHVDFEKSEATYQDGVLTLTLPKAEEAQPRMIQVRAASAQSNGSKSS